jgi:FKBP-type peptidyl-prolyl cis-trans isomerase
MATKRQRAFALFGAVLFLITSSFLTIAFLISNIQSKNNSDAASKANQATTSKTSTAQSSTTKAKLAGTQMQNFTPVSSVSTLQTTDLVAGTGQTVKASDKVTVDYTGAVAANGVIFQSSLDTGKPVTFGLSQVIPGWTQGVPGMKVGGTRRLVIPANLAYGASPPAGSGIPANAPLVFDITLHSIN